MDDYPDPTEDDLKDPMFNVIWDAIKHWDIRRDINSLYSGPTGNDVMHILKAVRECKP